MSIWKTIKDKEDIEYDSDTETIDILIGGDEQGNNYISVPVEYIINVLKNKMLENINGEFKISNLESGTYQINISAVGYSTIVKSDIIVNSGRPT